MGGSFFDKLSFNPGQYAQKIMSMDLQEHARRIYSKRRILASTHGRAIGGVLASPATGGLSLLGTAAAGYQGDTEERKLDVLEQTWQQRGQYPLPTHFIRDTLVPVVLSTAFGVLGFFIDFGGVVDGIVHKAVYWLGDSLHLTGQSSTNAIPGYYNEFTNKWMDFMGEKFGNKIVDSYNQRNSIPNGYYPHPQPGYPYLYKWGLSVPPLPCHAYPSPPPPPPPMMAYPPPMIHPIPMMAPPPPPPMVPMPMMPPPMMAMSPVPMMAPMPPPMLMY